MNMMSRFIRHKTDSEEDLQGFAMGRKRSAIFKRDAKAIIKLIENDKEPIDEKGTRAVADSKDPWIEESCFSRTSEGMGYSYILRSRHKLKETKKSKSSV